MASVRRTQESTIEPASFGFRFFKMKNALAASSSALAYRTTYDRSNKKWVKYDSEAALQRIYSPGAGFSAAVDDIVPCWFNPIAGHWEVFNQGTSTPGGMHLAVVPTSGIPARVGAVPGVATCDVYEIAAGVLVDALTDQAIYNIYPLSVSYNSYVPQYFQIYKDENGDWFNEMPVPTFSLGVPFRNDSGEVIPSGGIMEIYGDSQIANVNGVLHAFKPTMNFRRRYLVNSPSPVAVGATSLGSWLDDMSGFPAIDPGSVAKIPTYEGWGPMPGSWLLFPGRFGFTLEGLTTYLTTDLQIVVHARQHEVNHVPVRLYGALSYQTTGLARIWYYNSLGVQADAGFNPLTITDGLMLNPGDTIPDGTRAQVHWFGTRWNLANAACVVPDADASDQPAGGHVSEHTPFSNTPIPGPDFNP